MKYKYFVDETPNIEEGERVCTIYAPTQDDLSNMKTIMEKQEKMLIKLVESPDRFFNAVFYTAQCPRCGMEYEYAYHEYCPYCGQKLDWSNWR